MNLLENNYFILLLFLALILEWIFITFPDLYPYKQLLKLNILFVPAMIHHDFTLKTSLVSNSN